MPRYFFHLSFGDRTCRDEEGSEFPNRAAARAEAFAVIRDLARGRDEENGRGWAGWVLHIADAVGEFFSLPVDRPMLAGEVNRTRSSPTRQRPLDGRLTELASRLLELRERATTLMDQNQQLRQELALEFRRGVELRSAARALIAGVRSFVFDPATATDLRTVMLRPRRSRPHLVVLQGGLVKNS